MVKKSNGKNKPDTKSKKTGTKEVDPALHGVPFLDEIALRLQVKPLENPDRHPGVALLSKSGRWYAMEEYIHAHTQFTAQATLHILNKIADIEGIDRDIITEGVNPDESGQES